MKTLQIIKNGIWVAMLIVGVLACKDEDIVDFGFDGSIAGTLKDPQGNVVPGSITSANFVVRALGQGDQVTTDMRIKGDGTFANTKLYPKPYKVWVAGPVSLVTDTMVIDFSKQRAVVQDIVVKPFVRIDRPEVVANQTGTSVDIDYEMIPDDGKTVDRREVYFSTNPYPDTNTGSGPYYHTVKVTLPSDNGNISVTGLTSKTKYYVRIGAQAVGASGFNYSEQIVITTP
jgi:hypothetical protein